MADRGLIHIVDDDDAVRDSLEALLLAEGYDVTGFASAEAFLADRDPSLIAGCCLLDIRMPGMDGLTLLRELGDEATDLPVIIMTGHGDVPMAVKAMKLGALDFIEKPFDVKAMLDAIRSALRSNQASKSSRVDPALTQRIERLTPRERDVLEHLVAGRSNKEVGLELGISPRTVEIHRARLMEKMAADSLAQLVRMAIEAGIEPAG
ncbi:MAG: response regulator FixJ [Geminicoccaceae bacterium]